MKKRWIVIVVSAAVVVAVGATVLLVRAQRIEAAECELVHSLETATADPIGTGDPVTVVGDSYSQGFGLDDPRESWVSRLPMEVTVSASSGAGFTRDGLCGANSVTELAGTVSGAMILQGGLNDVDADMEALKVEVDSILDEKDVVAVIGPTTAPAFDAASIEQVNTVLRDSADDHDVLFIDATGWDLPFSDGIHLTPEGHEEYGDMVADALTQ